MLQPIVVIAVGVIGAEVGSTALRAIQRTRYDPLGNVEHQSDFQGEEKVGVKHLPLVVDADVLKALLKVCHYGLRFFQVLLIAVNANVVVHGLSHGKPKRCCTLAVVAVASQNAADVLPVFLQARFRHVWSGDTVRVQHRGRARPLAEYEGIEK